MTISVAETALDREAEAMKRCVWRTPLRNWLTWIYCVVFLASFTGFYVFWYTNTYHGFLLTRMVLRNGTQVYDWWQDPPFNCTCNIYLFNYTNVDDFEAGRASKLHVQELGPYSYSEKTRRVNVMMHENGTVSFQLIKTYQWIGGRPEDDVIMVPNVPLMFATAFVRDLNFAMRFSLSTVLSTLQEKPFINVTAGGYSWGYDNPLFEMAKPLLMFQQDIPFDKFGLLAMHNNTKKDRVTIHTGEKDVSKLGMIDQVNGLRNRNVWNDEKCDTVGGIEANLFPYYLIENTSNVLDIYSKELCKNLPFTFTEEVTTFGIPSLRYKLSPNIFTSPNECICSKVDSSIKEVCPPVGIFNISACNDNSPLLASLPHFYGGEKSLFEMVDGLNPEEKKHESYMDVHKFFGKAIAGWSRLQLNVEVRRAIGVPFLGKLKDRTILPLIWFEIGVDDLPEMILQSLDKNYFLIQAIEITLQWFTLIAMVMSLSALVTCFWKYRGERHKSFRENVSGQKNLELV